MTLVNNSNQLDETTRVKFTLKSFLWLMGFTCSIIVTIVTGTLKITNAIERETTERVNRNQIHDGQIQSNTNSIRLNQADIKILQAKDESQDRDLYNVIIKNHLKN